MATGAVLITGSSTGIGEACALDLAGRGFTVYAGVRKEADGERLVAQARGGSIKPVIVDVTDQATIDAAVKEIEAAVGAAGLAGVVNNAGVARGGPIEHLTVDDWREQFEVNVFGQLAVIRATLPLVRSAKGRIVLMGSIGGRLATPMIGPYCATKHAIEAIGDTLRLELQPWGIGVSIIEPGAVKTPIWAKGRETAAALPERLGPEATAQYRELIDGAARGIDKNDKASVPPQKVADAVAHALTASRPKTRYLVGRDAKVAAQIRRFLPDRVVDVVVRRVVM